MDRAIDHPSYRVPVLTWWHGIYDHVFVALHPFYRVPVEGAPSAAGTARFEETDGWQRDHGFGNAVKSRSEPVAWSEVHRAVAPEEPQDRVYRAIWLLSCTGFRDRADIALQKRIDAFCERERLFWPFDDMMPPNLEPAIGRFLARFGATSVTAWDEFRDNSVELRLSEFQADRAPVELTHGFTSRGVYGLHLPDPGVLLTWQFDCTEALVAMTDHAVARARPEEFFEGWYADAATYADVHNPRDFFDRDQ